MELFILGTSSGVPTKARNVSATAVCITNRKPWYLVDCGEGTQHRLLHLPLSLANLRAIFITHVHGDHTYGLPGLLATAAMVGRTEPLTIICPPEIETFIKQTQLLSDMFVNYPMEFIHTHSKGVLFSDDAIEVKAVPLSHRVPTHAFVFTKTIKKVQLDRQKLMDDGISQGPLWGKIQQGIDVQLSDGRTIVANDYRQVNQDRKRIIVSGDNDTPEKLADVAEGAHVLMHESTYTQEISDKVGKSPMHSSAKAVASFAERHNIPNLVLTHFSARYHSIEALNYSKIKSTKGHNIQEVEDEAKQYYSGNLILANDLEHYILDDQGQLNKNDNLPL
ncbi:ribonuclease Z [Glaciecola sp. 1036]|uniref:ribonuclease Z n=1 Tax=Alteromonadaceae TaxID=72275 RepID=UPI003D08AF8E